MSDQMDRLAVASQNGNLDAFATLYDEFFERIFRFIYYKTYHKELTRELTSQTFLRALAHLKKYRHDEGSFTSWLFRIARNEVADHFRSRKHFVNIADIWDLASPEDVEMDVGNREQWEHVHQHLQKLSSEQRELVMMRVWQNLSYREIAEVVGKSEASCRMAFSRVIGRLRQEMSLAVFLIFLPGRTNFP